MNSVRVTPTEKNRMPTAFFERVRAYCEGLQERICPALEETDGHARFTETTWLRSEGGGGRTRMMQDGAVFEKAGVNSSTVFGVLPETIDRTLKVNTARFSATGISLVVHPRSPMVPTIHANYRYFELEEDDAWFGGGSDLTPFYPFEEDIVHFHTTLKRACDSVDHSFYPRFKRWCDEYFFLPHRGEARGVGGIFFDYLRGNQEKHLALIRSAGDAFLDSYLTVVKRRMHEPWGNQERRWQLLRRGRYVEFNLLYDRGTKFGLESQGRTESVLMSLPPLVRWEYDVQPSPGSSAERLVEMLRRPREWAAS
jgi:coproporphyrinogen III oxidase